MTIASSLNKHIYTGNGATTQWPFTFKIFTQDGSDIKAYLTDLTTNAVTLITNNITVDVANSNVVYPSGVGSPISSNFKITIVREEPITQDTVLENQGAFFAKTIENSLDKLTAISQQLAEKIERSVQLPIDNAGGGETLLTDILQSVASAATAQTAAETAQALAETAQANAEGFADDAEGYANAAAASAASADWHNGGTITGNLAVTGTITGNVTGNVSGNATTATKLQTARKINGVNFDGSDDISIMPIAILNETQPSGTNGGTFTQGAWRTRIINTKVIDNIGITLNSNMFPLGVGDYEIIASAPAYTCNSHKIRLQNVTDNTTVALGTSAYSGSYAVTRSFLRCIVSIVSGIKNFQLEHYCTFTSASNGFGFALNVAGVNEIYSEIFIRKVG
jgi:hypothetical protein